MRVGIGLVTVAQELLLRGRLRLRRGCRSRIDLASRSHVGHTGYFVDHSALRFGNINAEVRQSQTGRPVEIDLGFLVRRICRNQIRFCLRQVALRLQNQGVG